MKDREESRRGESRTAGMEVRREEDKRDGGDEDREDREESRRGESRTAG